MKKLIAWVEIPTRDFKRGVNFYNEVLKLSLKELDFGTEKMAVLPDDEGAIFYKPGYEPSENGLIVSFNVPDSTTELAYASGYYDQSHFIHDFKTMTGYTPGQFFMERDSSRSDFFDD